MLKFLKELKRRNVIKASISYVVLSYALLEIATILTPILSLDKGYIRILLIVLVIVFPFWLIFAYIYEWTPKGFKQTDKIPEEESIYKATGKKLNHYIIGGLSLVIVLLVADRFFDFTGEMIHEKPKENIIAVLPFSHQSPEGNDDFFTSGVYEDVMTRLSSIKTFRIIAKSAVAEFKDYEGDMAVVSKRLNVNYVLQGAVRKLGQQVKITAQLIEAKTNQTVWSDEYNAKLENVFELQTNIATEIAEKLQANLSSEEKNKLEQKPTENIAAYEDYLMARYIVTRPRASYDEYQEGVRILDNALKADPKFAKAWTLLLQIHSARYDILSRVPDQEKQAQMAKEATLNALNTAKKLAPNSADVLSEQGFYLNYIEGDKLGALKAFEKALEQNPSDESTMRELSILYTYFGEPKKSITILEEAFKVTQSNGFFSYGLSLAYEIMGDYEKMIPLLTRLYEFYPKEKHYLVESKYYQFLLDGKTSSFTAFKETVENSETEFPWDERAVKNKQMVVAMFNDKFDEYHANWLGHMEDHTKSHNDNDWICPMVANDNINHARLLLEMGDPAEGTKMLEEVKSIVLKPINYYSVCTFNPEIYLPKLDFLAGDEELAKKKLEEVALDVVRNKSYPTGAVERAVLVQAADLIAPEKVYYYYSLVKNTISFTSFEAICADPWTYPNLINDPQFIEEVKTDGRFVEFLESFGFLKG